MPCYFSWVYLNLTKNFFFFCKSKIINYYFLTIKMIGRKKILLQRIAPLHFKRTIMLSGILACTGAFADNDCFCRKTKRRGDEPFQEADEQDARGSRFIRAGRAEGRVRHTDRERRMLGRDKGHHPVLWQLKDA